MKFVIALAALALVAAPVVAEELLAVPLADSTFYVSDSGHVFEENGLCAGLQETAENCDTTNDIVNPDGSITETLEAADDQLA